MGWKPYDPAVAAAFRAVHREDFLPAEQLAHAGDDTALPIGYAQTISQPSLVAAMTAELHLKPQSRVLEIGTGSGFQTAILAEIAAEVFTIERVPALATAARERLEALGYRNIQFRTGDGTHGWPEAAPFNAIIVTAAARVLPDAYPAQLGLGGRLVIPLGELATDNQTLILIEKDDAGEFRTRELCAVRFVPLITS
jgi:protein-L-isoaspartate(D-aspartate) O-methyltransferase